MHVCSGHVRSIPQIVYTNRHQVHPFLLRPLPLPPKGEPFFLIHTSSIFFMFQSTYRHNNPFRPLPFFDLGRGSLFPTVFGLFDGPEVRSLVELVFPSNESPMSYQTSLLLFEDVSCLWSS